MWRPAFALLLLPLFATPAPAMRGRLIRRFAPLPAAANVLWIAAHPDDELLAAPLLDLYCRERRARCTFAVATRGESGWCELPVCSPDLATVREQELRASASFFSAAVVAGSFADGSSPSPAGVLLRWRTTSPSIDAFVDSLFTTIRPNLVLTLDPRHGSTCHPDHRAIGAVAIAAARRHGVPVAAVLLRALPVGDWEALAVSPNLADADFVLDAAAPAATFDGSRWDALATVARTHASQFSQRAVAAIDGVPREKRLIGVDFLDDVPSGDACAP
ncbi:MAG TPA: PIG-L family deacetylase [Thermoanaerobaculia bacterium]